MTINETCPTCGGPLYRCVICGNKMDQKAVGRWRKTCSDMCRQNLRRRKAGVPEHKPRGEYKPRVILQLTRPGRLTLRD